MLRNKNGKSYRFNRLDRSMRRCTLQGICSGPPRSTSRVDGTARVTREQWQHYRNIVRTRLGSERRRSALPTTFERKMRTRPTEAGT